MSRYKFDSIKNNIEITVGWDPPLCTFFFSVFDKRLKGTDSETIAWEGKSFFEIVTIEDLVHRVRKWGEIPEKIQNQLYCDQIEFRLIHETPLTNIFQNSQSSNMSNEKEADIDLGNINALKNKDPSSLMSLKYSDFNILTCGITYHTKKDTTLLYTHNERTLDKKNDFKSNNDFIEHCLK
jgi:hypothetical protein